MSLRGRAREKGQAFTTAELSAALQRSVTELTGGKQTPHYADRETEGQFLFVPGGALGIGGAVVAGDPNAYLRVNDPQGATVKLDGVVQTAVTPCTLTIPLAELKTKTVTVALTPPGGEEITRTVTLTRGQTTPLLLPALLPAAVARLQVTTDPPGATVLLDGTAQPEKTPCTLTIPLGDQPTKTLDVVTKLQDFADTLNTVTLERGKLTPVQVTLQTADDEPDLNAYLEVTTTPPGATVEVDKQTKITPCRFTFPLGVLRTKELEVKISHDWYDGIDQTVTLERGKTMPMELILNEQDIARVQVTTVPPGVTVLLDGKKRNWIDVTPCIFTIDIGGVREKSVELGLTIGAGGAYADAIRNLTLTRGKLTPVTVTLRRTVSAAQPPTDLTKIGQESTNAVDGAVMVWVPAGEFTMGSDNGSPDEKPAHQVYLDGYWIYKNDVTVAQYRKFCEVTGRNMPEEPKWGWQDDHPIVNVTWYDAAAYALWAGVALPTEAEWEKAARGTDGREYPWGNEWDAAKCQFNKQATAPVGSYPAGISPYGCLDMAGNVWQWCADWYGADYYSHSPTQNPTGPETGRERVVHGGSWECCYSIGAPTRDSDNTPARRDKALGFRCVSRSPGP